MWPTAQLGGGFLRRNMPPLFPDVCDLRPCLSCAWPGECLVGKPVSGDGFRGAVFGKGILPMRPLNVALVAVMFAGAAWPAGQVLALDTSLDQQSSSRPEQLAQVNLAGANSNLVLATQQLLSQLGLNPGPINGQLSPLTEVAVRDFQNRYNLGATGVIDENLVMQLQRTVAQTTGMPPVTGPRGAMIGSVERPITLQELVNGNVPPASAGGVQGSVVQVPVVQVPVVQGPVVLGPVVQAPIQHVAQIPTNVIAEVQSHLVTLGFGGGQPDGLLGRETSTAVASYQQRAGLQVDGQITPQLLTSLRHAVVSPTLNVPVIGLAPSNPPQSQAFAGQAFPGQTFAGQSFSGQTYPGQSFPGQAFPGQAFPGQTFPGQSHPGQTTPGRPTVRLLGSRAD